MNLKNLIIILTFVSIIVGSAYAVAPIITNINPNSGVNSNYVINVDIYGMGFIPGSNDVKLVKGTNEVLAENVQYIDENYIRCYLKIMDAEAGSYDVRVTNDGSEWGTLSGGFTVIAAAPTVSGITPSSGVNSGPVTVTDLSGSGFVSGAVINLTKSGETNVTATSVVVVSPTKITCVLPITGAAVGQWNIDVKNSDGQLGTLTNGFTVSAAAPTVSGIDPDTGVNNVDVTVTNLSGSGFVSGAVVNLTKSGETNVTATSVVVVSPTKITCVLPITGAAVGQWNIDVKNSDGQLGTLTNGFTVTAAAPTVSGIDPDTGVNNVDVTVTNLSGSGFVSGAVVNLTKNGEKNVTATSVVVVSPTKITCVLPITGAAVGQWNIDVTNSDGQLGTLTNGFTVTAAAPTVSGIDPDTGVNNVDVTVTNLSGSGFVSGAVVNLTKSGETNVTATSVVVVSPTKITCVLPITGAAVGQWNIDVTNSDGQLGTLTNGFTVTAAAPTVSGIDPDTGVNNVDVTVTNLSGSGFVSGAVVNLTKSGETNVTATSVVVVSPTKITCVLPITGAAVGQWNIDVTNSDGQLGTLTNGFTVTAAAPTVSGIDPDTGVNNVDVTVTDLAGTGFASGAVVNLTKTGETNVTATSVVVASPTKITCVLPISGAAVGQWNITVTNSDDQSGTLTNGFTVTAAAPVAAFSANRTSGTNPLTVQFNDTSSGGAPTAWYWNFGNGTWFNTTDPLARNASYTYSAAGTYTAQLTVSNIAGENTNRTPEQLSR